jgi:hypothetical protein
LFRSDCVFRAFLACGSAARTLRDASAPYRHGRGCSWHGQHGDSIGRSHRLVNEEAAIIAGDESAKPGLSLLAASFGWLLIIPPFSTHWTTANRVGSATGYRPAAWANVICSILLLPLAGIVYVIWIQGKLNKYGRWQRAQAHRSAVATTEVQSVSNWT